MKIRILTELRVKRKELGFWYNATAINEKSQLIQLTVPGTLEHFNHLLKVDDNVMVINASMKITNETLFVAHQGYKGDSKLYFN